jgi:hypothetical protein
MGTSAAREWCIGMTDVGAQSLYAAAGMTEVSRPGKRRVVMRIDLSPRSPGDARTPIPA